ncbi:MAG TPA: hypothetical protein VHA52_00420 [Candidatus Babeliaceae bacterium]|nr:hypothetical protein [Candidatus Babeliaceae bacterium]
MPIELSIISATSKKTLKVTWIEVNTPTGNLVIQEGHTPLITLLSHNEPCIIQLLDGKQESFTTNGILTVEPSRAIIIQQV